MEKVPDVIKRPREEHVQIKEQYALGSGPQ
jgi:hypothetical protein